MRRAHDRAQMPIPPRQRGSSAGQSLGDVHVREQRVVSVPSTHSALAQSFSPVHVAPGAPCPRGPGSQYTWLGSAAWQRVPAGQSSLEKHGHSFGIVHWAAAASVIASIADGASRGGSGSPPHAARTTRANQDRWPMRR